METTLTAECCLLMITSTYCNISIDQAQISVLLNQLSEVKRRLDRAVQYQRLAQQCTLDMELGTIKYMLYMYRLHLRCQKLRLHHLNLLLSELTGDGV